MTGAFEFSFCCKPVRGTTQMGAFCLDYVQSVTLLTIHILNCFLNLSLTPDVYWNGYPIVYLVGGSKIVLGKKNLIVAPDTAVKNAPIKPQPRR